MNPLEAMQRVAMMAQLADEQVGQNAPDRDQRALLFISGYEIGLRMGASDPAFAKRFISSTQRIASIESWMNIDEILKYLKGEGEPWQDEPLPH